jgi:hypothetical protein
MKESDLMEDIENLFETDRERQLLNKIKKIREQVYYLKMQCMKEKASLHDVPKGVLLRIKQLDDIVKEDI